MSSGFIGFEDSHDSEQGHGPANRLCVHLRWDEDNHGFIQPFFSPANRTPAGLRTIVRLQTILIPVTDRAPNQRWAEQRLRHRFPFIRLVSR
jgi:hypothetical protein